jgi:hypothetical protein
MGHHDRDVLRRQLRGVREEPTGERLNALLELLPGDESLDAETVGELEHSIRGGFGDEDTHIAGHYDEHIAFWRELARRYPGSPKLLGFEADTLLLAGRVEEAMKRFLDAFAVEPRLVYEFGGEIADFMGRDPDDWLAYQLVLVRAALANDDREYASDLYSTLLKQYANDEPAMRTIRRAALERP